jgi:SAM-dependent methyltransferase
MTPAVDRVRVFGEQAGAIERIAPGFFPDALEAEHLARYCWAARWAAGQTVLDVACGTGYGAGILKRAGARSVLSVDISADALAFGRRWYGIVALRADAHRLPIISSSIQLVVSFETLEHLHDPAAFLREVRRVLVPGAALFLSTPNATRSAGVNPYHAREFTVDELLALLGETGFHIRAVAGQRWAFRRPAFRTVPGLRRLTWMLERRSSVVPRFLGTGEPLLWCVRARRV